MLSEFGSVLAEGALASPNSAAVDSADRSADQDLSSDEYSELTQDLTLQLDDSGTSSGAGAGATAVEVQQFEQASQLEQLGHSPDTASSGRPATSEVTLEPAQTAFGERQPVVGQ